MPHSANGCRRSPRGHIEIKHDRVNVNGLTLCYLKTLCINFVNDCFESPLYEQAVSDFHKCQQSDQEAQKYRRFLLKYMQRRYCDGREDDGMCGGAYKNRGVADEI
jgi:hypothetical protein